MHDLNNDTQYDRTESGMAIAFLAIAVVVLIGMIGLPIDSGMLATTSSQYRHTAEYAVVAAMEEYLRSTDVDGGGNADYASRLQDAVVRAKEVVQLDANVRSSLGSGFFVNPTATRDDIGRSGLGGGPNGTLTAGTWNRTTRTFTAVGDGVRADALRLQLKPLDSSPLRTIFMRLLGHETAAFSVSAVATVSPVHAVVVMDLSHASTFDNFWKNEQHIPSLPSVVQRAEYALELDKSGAKTCADPSVLNTFEDSTVAFGGKTSPRQIFSELAANRPGGPVSPLTGVHYQSDYSGVCVDVNFHDPAAGLPTPINPAETRSFRLNTAVVPEPLHSFLAGAHEIFDVLERRKVSGDMIGFLGAEVYRHPDRRMAMTIPDKSDPTSEFSSFYRSTAPLGDTALTPAAWATQVAERGLFPYNSWFNMPKALVEAREMLSTVRTTGAKEMVFLFTSGVSNCRSVGNCVMNDPAHIQNSYTDSTTEVVTNYLNPVPSPLNSMISLNVILGGTVDGGSTIMRRFDGYDSVGRSFNCAPDWFARRKNLGFVDSTFNAGVSDFFYTTNSLYNTVAAPTHGLYFPLRACCSLNGCSCATQAELTNVGFQSKCAAAGADGALVSDLGNVELNKFLDSSRLLCDPYGRTKLQQVKSAVSDVFNTSPISIVSQ